MDSSTKKNTSIKLTEDERKERNRRATERRNLLTDTERKERNRVAQAKINALTSDEKNARKKRKRDLEKVQKSKLNEDQLEAEKIKRSNSSKKWYKNLNPTKKANVKYKRGVVANARYAMKKQDAQKEIEFSNFLAKDNPEINEKQSLIVLDPGLEQDYTGLTELALSDSSNTSFGGSKRSKRRSKRRSKK